MALEMGKRSEYGQNTMYEIIKVNKNIFLKELVLKKDTNENLSKIKIRYGFKTRNLYFGPVLRQYSL